MVYLLAVLFLLAGSPAFALTNDGGPVHLAPAVAPAAEGVLKTHTRPLRANVELVLVPVTVTNSSNHLVTGLEAEHFVVYEDGVKQQIRHFSREDSPISLAVVFDASGSMGGKVDRARQAVVEFFSTASASDEFILVTVSSRPELASDFTSSVEDIQNRLVFTVPEGRTALLDAIYLGLDRLRHARHPRKAMLIISDGGDNNSRYTHDEIKSVVREADVRIYAIGMFDGGRPRPEEMRGPLLLSEITDATGGRTHRVRWPSELVDVATQIGVELRNQYVLGYHPERKSTEAAGRPQWRRVKIELALPKGVPTLRVYGKTGYYASAE